MEALLQLWRDTTKEDVAEIQVEVSKSIAQVIGILVPVDGQQIKFSVRHLCAMIVAGIDVRDPSNYTEAVASRFDVVEARHLIRVVECDIPRTAARVVVRKRDGSLSDRHVDVGMRGENDLESCEWFVIEKFTSIAEPIYGKSGAAGICDLVLTIEKLSCVDELTQRLADCS